MSGEMSILGGEFGEFVPQVGAGRDAAVVVGEGKLLVGAVGVVVVLAPAQQQHVDAELVGRRC